MLAHEEAHACVSNIADNVGQRSNRGLEAVFPSQFHIRHQELTAAATTEARLERHEDPRRLFVAGNALAVEEFDSRDGTAITIASCGPPTQTARMVYRRRRPMCSGSDHRGRLSLSRRQSAASFR